MLDKPGLPCGRGVLDTNANLRPSAIEALDGEGLEDPIMNMLNVRRSTVPVRGVHEELQRVQLLGFSVEALRGEKFLDPLRKLEALASVGRGSELRGTKLLEARHGETEEHERQVHGGRAREARAANDCEDLES